MKRLLFVLVPQLAAASPEQMLADVQASYAKVEHVQAKFDQTFTNTTFGRTDPSSGTLYLVRPDKMRWDYVKAKAKSIIYDGKTLWVVEPSNKQVFEHATTDPVLPAAIAFLNGGSLAEQYTLSAPDDHTLVLVPKQTTAQIKTLTFVIDPKTKRVVKSIVVNSNDDINTFAFTKVDVTTVPSAKTFQFSPKRAPLFKVIHVD